MTDIVDRLNDSLSAGYSELRKEAAAEITRLRARIEAMEKQEPGAWIYEDMLGRKCVGFNKPLHRLNTHEPLYLAPGAKGE